MNWRESFDNASCSATPSSATFRTLLLYICYRVRWSCELIRLCMRRSNRFPGVSVILHSTAIKLELSVIGLIRSCGLCSATYLWQAMLTEVQHETGTDSVNGSQCTLRLHDVAATVDNCNLRQSKTGQIQKKSSNRIN